MTGLVKMHCRGAREGLQINSTKSMTGPTRISCSGGSARRPRWGLGEELKQRISSARNNKEADDEVRSFIRTYPGAAPVRALKEGRLEESCTQQLIDRRIMMREIMETSGVIGSLAMAGTAGHFTPAFGGLLDISGVLKSRDLLQRVLSWSLTHDWAARQFWNAAIVGARSECER
jgi:uncharacterized protein with von Willebrand factor type A (vWA) domain